MLGYFLAVSLSLSLSLARARAASLSEIYPTESEFGGERREGRSQIPRDNRYPSTVFNVISRHPYGHLRTLAAM